jgi:ADP-ribosylglycohydrolase
MTIAISEALIGLDDLADEDIIKSSIVKSMQKWGRKYPDIGYGQRFYNWFMSENPQPYGSWGNGSAMRVSPVGWLYDSIEETRRIARLTAEVTHNHPEGIKGAQIIAYAIHNAVVSFDCPLPPDKFKDELIELVVVALCDGDYDTEINLEDYRNKFDETCQGTVPVAIEIIFNSDSFEDAIRRAVSLGADADTLGAIVGSIAEHIWGIPDWIKEKALSYLPDEMLQVVDAFYVMNYEG